ncbi:MAG: hypothetical protein IT287_04330, partial [Bdellovibrionaceae bacterium]|nr:hypothetical protein [Pseudobdellovibrionaceae bacterium]
MKGAKHLLIVLLLLGCATKKDYRIIAIPDVLNKDDKKVLSALEVKADIEQMYYALSTTYSGRKFLPGTQFIDMIAEIDRISGPQSVEEFCKKIDTAFEKV